jgi:putative copper resistance protein D
MGELVLAHGGPDAIQPPLTPLRLLTGWDIEPGLLLGLLVAGGLYLLGVRRLKQRGVDWSGWRTTLWFTGLGTVFVATSSAVGAYDTTLFSAHAVQHMLLQMAAPIPLGMATPITLALRTLPRNPRKLFLAVVHSRVVRVLTHPLVTFAIFVVSPFALYYTDLYEATLRSDLLHNFNHMHFLLVGCLFFWPLLGADPLPNAMPYIFRFMMFLGLAPMHVLLGIPLMMSSQVIAEDFYRELGRDWGPSLLTDQYIGGGILWVFADVVSLIFLAAFGVQWMRHDRRETRRVDRHLDRLYGDAIMTPPWWEQPADEARTEADQQDLPAGEDRARLRPAP